MGAKGSGSDPWTTLGLDGKQAPRTCHLLFCADGINGLGSGQWPEGSGVVSRFSPPPDHRVGKRGLDLGLSSFVMEIKILYPGGRVG